MFQGIHNYSFLNQIAEYKLPNFVPGNQSYDLTVLMQQFFFEMEQVRLFEKGSEFVFRRQVLDN